MLSRRPTQAVLDAEKYATPAMLRFSWRVMGESMKAEENAQKVLDAKDAGDAAVDKSGRCADGC